MRLELVTNGKRYSVWAIVQSEDPYSCEAISFLGSLGEATRKKVANILRLHAEEGPLKNEQKSRLLEDGIYEFKTTDGARLLYFFAPGQRTVLTHGFKKGGKVATGIRRAKRLRMEWMEQSC
ncbi:MAG: type II toxin-antitoxin system RelE/ParE family toxin [Dehalococcoidia bacterium]|nr:type II toxin-antitoxin system RelE/ParE family toxin [Dehalococcoidia bacterium]